MVFSKVFLADASERALKTVAQVVLALLTVDGADILSLDYGQVASAALTAGVISILTSIVSASARGSESASLTINPPTPVKEDTEAKG
jgi:hypothetical protein